MDIEHKLRDRHNVAHAPVLPFLPGWDPCEQLEQLEHDSLQLSVIDNVREDQEVESEQAALSDGDAYVAVLEVVQGQPQQTQPDRYCPQRESQRLDPREREASEVQWYFEPSQGRQTSRWPQLPKRPREARGRRRSGRDRATHAADRVVVAIELVAHPRLQAAVHQTARDEEDL